MAVFRKKNENLKKIMRKKVEKAHKYFYNKSQKRGTKYKWVPRSRVPDAPIPDAPCPMPHARCPMPGAPCPVPHARCPMPRALPHAPCPAPCPKTFIKYKSIQTNNIIAQASFNKLFFSVTSLNISAPHKEATI